jgi:hypothetical protein
MPIEEIPKSYRYTCDICGDTHIQPNANGHYTDSTPKWWSRLKFQPSNAFSTDSVRHYDLLLCNNCTGAAALKLGQLIRQVNYRGVRAILKRDINLCFDGAYVQIDYKTAQNLLEVCDQAIHTEEGHEV